MNIPNIRLRHVAPVALAFLVIAAAERTAWAQDEADVPQHTFIDDFTLIESGKALGRSSVRFSERPDSPSAAAPIAETRTQDPDPHRTRLLVKQADPVEAQGEPTTKTSSNADGMARLGCSCAHRLDSMEIPTAIIKTPSVVSRTCCLVS